MKFTLAYLEEHGYEIQWFDFKGGANSRSYADGERFIADNRGSRMFILGNMIVEYTSPISILFFPLSSVYNGWAS